MAFGGNSFLVTYNNRTSAGPVHIYGARVATNGTVLDPLGFPIFEPAKSGCSASCAFCPWDRVGRRDQARRDINAAATVGATAARLGDG